jgi:SH3 domain
LKNEIQAGKREGSVISTRSVEAARGGDETVWLEISRELEEAGISEDKINEHRTFITTWLINAFESGQLEEKPPTAPSDGPEGDSTPLEIDQDVLGSTSNANDVVDAVFSSHLRHGSEITLPEDIDSEDGSDGFISGAAQKIADFHRLGREAIENADYMDAEQQLWKAMDLAVLVFGNESKRVRDCGSILEEFYMSSPLLPPRGFSMYGSSQPLTCFSVPDLTWNRYSYDRPIPDIPKFDSSRLRPSSLDPSKVDLSKLSPSRLHGEHSRIDPSKLDFCRVLWDYAPEAGVELPGVDITVRKGDIIAVLSRSDPEGNPSEWWKCRTRDARIGYLPAVYLELRPVPKWT